MPLIPIVINKNEEYEHSYDIYSRLLEERIIFLTGPIDANLASTIIAQMLYLESQNPTADISLYINSPGGEVNSGLAIYDTMQFIQCNISTICVGEASSMAALLLASGNKRYALRHAEMMIHQPLGETSGQASDILITAKHIQKIKDKTIDILNKHTHQTKEKIAFDIERDYYLNSQEAKAYGLIDEVLETKPII